MKLSYLTRKAIAANLHNLSRIPREIVYSEPVQSKPAPKVASPHQWDVESYQGGQMMVCHKCGRENSVRDRYTANEFDKHVRHTYCPGQKA